MHIWSDNEADVDLLRFRYIASTIVGLINTPYLLPTTIGLYSDWGGGKSTLLKMVQAELAQDPATLCLLFDGWLFEGYEDAKSAVMGTILDAIADATVENRSLSEKGRDLLSKLVARVNWFRLAGLAGRYVGPTLLGMPHLTLANAIQDVTGAIGRAPDALRAAKLDPEEAKALLREAPEGAENVRRSIRDFRADFGALLEDAKIERLVVLIDDLDRCLPDTIIETLEAIKLFLYAPGTAFVLAADERLVQYAVRQRFPELPGPEVEVGRDYLEKLVQIPIKVPPLSGADIWSYVNLLFAQHSLDEGVYARVCESVATSRPNNVSDLSFDLTSARALLGDGGVPGQLQQDLDFAAQIVPVLIPGLAGNPRRTKRFLNTLILRLQLAEARGLELQRRVMAKLMLLEYLKPEFFLALAQWQAAQGGKPEELVVVESSACHRGEAGKEDPADAAPPQRGGERPTPRRVGAEHREAAARDVGTRQLLPAEAQAWLADEWMKDWLSSEPPLADVDLRPYYYIAHDKVGALAGVRLRLSPAATDVLNRLLDPGGATQLVGLERAASLSGPDATAVFEGLAQRIRQAEILDDASPQRVLFEFVGRHRDLLPQLVSLYGALPDPKITAETPALLLTATRGTPSADAAAAVLERWTHSTNDILAQAATITLRRRGR